METKTYFASSVPAAIEVARKELGPDAMLVNSRPSPAAVKGLGRLEVTFSYHAPPSPGFGSAPTEEYWAPLYTASTSVSQPQSAQPQSVPQSRAPNVQGNLSSPFSALRSFTPGGARPQTPESDGMRASLRGATTGTGKSADSAGSPLPPASAIRSFSRGGTRAQTPELDEIRLQLRALRTAVDRDGSVRPGSHNDDRTAGSVPAENALVAKLCARGLESDTAKDLAAEAAKLPGDRGAALVEVLTRRIPLAAFDEPPVAISRTLAFVGPAGRGKSTSLVKVALRYGLSRRIPVKIYSAGAHGVGCQEQMARYATLLGVPFQSVESLDSLEIAMVGETWKGLVLIDTPGLSAFDTTEMSGLCRFFSGHPEIERHLVLRADTRSADMQHMASRFAPLGPSRLLFTGAEEALSLGAMVDTLIRTGIPATFVGTGPRIPEDIEELSVTKLAKAVCGESVLAAAAA